MVRVRGPLGRLRVSVGERRRFAADDFRCDDVLTRFLVREFVHDVKHHLLHDPPFPVNHVRAQHDSALALDPESITVTEGVGGLDGENPSRQSGDALLGEAGTASFCNIQSGALEASNVDLTAQLVQMITAQRNFQANAQAIETADAITQTVINIR